jgi:hypothetical protein
MKTCSELSGSFANSARTNGLPAVFLTIGVAVGLKCSGLAVELFYDLGFRPTRELAPAVVAHTMRLTIVDYGAPS